MKQLEKRLWIATSVQLIGIDTNILIRLLTRDDAAQYDLVVALVGNTEADQPLIVNPVVVAETIWVLEKSYGTNRTHARTLLSGILDSVEFMAPKMLKFEMFQDWLQSKHKNFSDVIIAGINQENGCSHTLTFDKIAAGNIPSMELLT